MEKPISKKQKNGKTDLEKTEKMISKIKGGL